VGTGSTGMMGALLSSPGKGLSLVLAGLAGVCTGAWGFAGCAPGNGFSLAVGLCCGAGGCEISAGAHQANKMVATVALMTRAEENSLNFGCLSVGAKLRSSALKFQCRLLVHSGNSTSTLDRIWD